MNGHLNELLSAYVDDDVTALERMKVEAHVAQCDQCRADLEGLRRVVRRASTLDDRPPQRDLWRGIAERIGKPEVVRGVVRFVPRRIAFTVPQLIAAAVVLMALSAGSAKLLLQRGAGAPAVPVVATRDASPEVQLVAGYDAPIRELQQLLAQRRSRLDTATVRVIEQSLTVIDAAIRQAQDALAKDPNNPYLSGHLQKALDRKLEVLRQAVTLPVVS